MRYLIGRANASLSSNDLRRAELSTPGGLVQLRSDDFREPDLHVEDGNVSLGVQFWHDEDGKAAVIVRMRLGTAEPRLTLVSVEAETHVEHVTLVDLPARPVEATSARRLIGIVNQSNVHIAQRAGLDGDLHTQISFFGVGQLRRRELDPTGVYSLAP